ncbi:MAG: MarR family winged helix-turn-helix transcriptional regulator [Candidatus Limivivens sp.]|nr:MarR family winged helix-turn-helix transcriptional regulator [Candidatus Limivivens sp.]
MERNPGRSIASIFRKSQLYWNQALKEADIGAAESPILLLLYRGDGRTQEEITQEVGVDKSAIARAVQALETKGFLARRKDEADRRCNRIYLTEKAESYREAAEAAKLQWNTILQNHMSEEEQEMLSRLLQTAAANAKEWSDYEYRKE